MEVIIPVNCSCSGPYYQANTSYIVQQYDTPFLISITTFQGLSTCQAIQNQSNISATYHPVGQRIPIPLRCACPTKNQSDTGIKYLLSHTVASGDSVYTISVQFGADPMETLAANEFSGINIYPFTTLLVPLRNPLSSSQILSPPPPPSLPSPSSPSQSQSSASNKTWVYIVIAVAATICIILVVFLIALFLFFHIRKRSKADTMLISKKDDSILTSNPLNKESKVESHELLVGIADVVQSIKVYKFEELQSATENFSPKCWINGSVYRGTINGDLAAIKKINGDCVQRNKFTLQDQSCQYYQSLRCLFQ